MDGCTGAYHSQVPVTCITVLVKYCHACSGWLSYVGRFTQTGDGDPDWEENLATSHGPFDTVTDVHDDLCSALMNQFHAPGRPWDPRHFPQLPLK